RLPRRPACLLQRHAPVVSRARGARCLGAHARVPGRAPRLTMAGDPGIGRRAERTFHVDDAALEAFSGVSGDRNPVHLDDAYAATTPFGGRVAHGMLPAAYFPALFAGELPGP